MNVTLDRWQQSSASWMHRSSLAWGIIVNIYLAGRFSCGDCIPIIAQINQVMHWLLLPNIFLFGVGAIASRKWLLLAWQLPGIVMFISVFGALWLPRPAPDANGIEIKVATFNVLGHAADPDQTFALIEALEANIVALQELRPALRDKLQTDLAVRYPFQASHINRISGLGLLSRYPFREEPYFSYDLGLYSDDDMSPRYLRTVVDIESHAVVVYVYHPPPPSFKLFYAYNDQANQNQARILADLIANEDLPVLLLCDCNTTPHGNQYRTLDSVLNDAFAQRGWGFGLTFPAKFPLVRIDYVWHTSDIVAIEARVSIGGVKSTSDHLPVVASLVLPNQ